MPSGHHRRARCLFALTRNCILLILLLFVIFLLSRQKSLPLSVTQNLGKVLPPLVHPALLSCPASACSPEKSCWTFNGLCDTVNAILVPKAYLAVDEKIDLVVTALVFVRSDRPDDVWLNWVEEYSKIPAHVFAWLPKEKPHFTSTFLKRRAQYSNNFKTYVVEIAATQLPYAYVIPSVISKFSRGLQLDSTWNRSSPEVTDPAYVPLQFSKIPFLYATSHLLKANSYIWTDIGLARHIPDFGSSEWPNAKTIASMPSESVYVTSWSGYGDAANAWETFCDRLPASFSENRNLLSGTIIVASKPALERFLPVWTRILEHMVNPSVDWNNEQPVFSLIGCFLPDLVNVIDAKKVEAFWDILATLGSPKLVSSPTKNVMSMSDFFIG